jgi:hypothetical protein
MLATKPTDFREGGFQALICTKCLEQSEEILCSLKLTDKTKTKQKEKKKEQ